MSASTAASVWRRADASVTPLAGIRIVELAGLAPAPFAAMMLADHGAEVIRVERAGWSHPIPREHDILLRGRAETLPLDLRDAADVDRFRALVRDADGLIEGFRPGAMERLGLGPADLAPLNPRLVYGRLTGWGQAGPLSERAGHDINYLALAGNLGTYGSGERPIPPANAVADFGGGGMMLAFAMLAGILAARATGQGSVIDAAMIDGAALLSAQVRSLGLAGMWRDGREANLLDGGAAFYRAYRCADGGWIALGALEPAFFAIVAERLGLACGQGDPGLAAELETRFAERPRDEWAALFADTDGCVTPILSMAEAPAHPHHRARGTFIARDGRSEPAPAPRFGPLPA